MVVLEWTKAVGNFLHDYVVTKLQCFDGQYCPQMDCSVLLKQKSQGSYFFTTFIAAVKSEITEHKKPSNIPFENL